MSEDNVDAERLQLPRKESKIGNLTKNSRQASPVDVPTPTGSDSGGPIRKHGGFAGRKRKHDSVEVCTIWNFVSNGTFLLHYSHFFTKITQTIKLSPTQQRVAPPLSPAQLVPLLPLPQAACSNIPRAVAQATALMTSSPG